MTFDEYCEYTLGVVNANALLTEMNEKELQRQRDAFDYGRRSVIMELSEIFGTVQYSFEKMDNILKKIETMSRKEAQCCGL